MKPITGFALIDAWLSDSPYRAEMIGSALRHMILPIAALAVAPTTEVVRLMRISTDDVLSQNYIKAAATAACRASPSFAATCCTMRCRRSCPNWGCSSPPCSRWR